MTGAHRSANSGSSSCQSSYAPADAAHNVNNMFHQTQVALMAFYGGNGWQAIQWHGMGVDTCDENAFLSHGMAINPGASDKNLQLKNTMTGKHPSWDLGTPVSGGCALNATDNVQGRLINGVNPANVCSTAASNYNGRFLHIEQDPGFRTAADWIPSVNEVWGAAVTPPPAPASLAASGGNAQVSLCWNAAQGANTYNVHRSTVSGGPYATIATGIATTSHLDTTVTNGTTYYYVVSGQNGAGEGPDSNQASATPQAPQLPPAPTGVAATSPMKRKINVAWNAVAGATSYRVKRSTTSGGPYTVVGTPTGTSFMNSGLTSGTTYYYVVSAVNSVGEGANSAQVSAVAK